MTKKPSSTGKVSTSGARRAINCQVFHWHRSLEAAAVVVAAGPGLMKKDSRQAVSPPPDWLILRTWDSLWRTRHGTRFNSIRGWE